MHFQDTFLCTDRNKQVLSVAVYREMLTQIKMQRGNLHSHQSTPEILIESSRQKQPGMDILEFCLFYTGYFLISDVILSTMFMPVPEVCQWLILISVSYVSPP